MRKTLILMMCLMLTACVDDAASYYIDGSDHSLNLRREQQYFWSNQATLTLVAARMPECQRRHKLAPAPVADVAIDVFAAGENAWTLKSGTSAWQVETQTCSLTEAAPKGEPGVRVGSFKIRNKALVFEAAAGPASISNAQ